MGICPNQSREEGICIPRPRKWRIVESIPGDIYFVPHGKPKCEVEEMILRVEELEAIRLKDIVNLAQEECADKMMISRQTFQRILSEARNKIARALIEGMAIRVAGGDFTQHICKVFCRDCNQKWEESYEKFCLHCNDGHACPKCGSTDIVCCGRQKREACQKKNCRKKVLADEDSHT